MRSFVHHGKVEERGSLWGLAAVLVTALMLAGCSDPVGSESTTTVGPYDESAEVRPDLMRVAPSVVAAGTELDLLFPEETFRGIHFVLESQNSDTWSLEYHLISDAAGAEPSIQGPTGTREYPDIGVDGPGPDSVLIPETAESGEYRICTGNARPNFCALLRIED